MRIIEIFSMLLLLQEEAKEEEESIYIINYPSIIKYYINL